MLALIAQYTGDDAVTLIAGKYKLGGHGSTCTVVNYGTANGLEFSDWHPPTFRKDFCGTFTRFAREVASTLFETIHGLSVS